MNFFDWDAAVSDAERDRLADAYAQEHLRADSAAAEGFVDEIVTPAETRDRLRCALHAFAPAGVDLVQGGHAR